MYGMHGESNLHWGHEFSFMETVISISILFIGSMLRWGHEFSCVEIV